MERQVCKPAIFKEHLKSGHEWRDVTDDIPRFNIDVTTKRIYRCTCGFLGWFDKE